MIFRTKPTWVTVNGMDVVDAIAGVKTGTQGMHQDVPVEPVTILKVERASGQ